MPKQRKRTPLLPPPPESFLTMYNDPYDPYEIGVSVAPPPKLPYGTVMIKRHTILSFGILVGIVLILSVLLFILMLNLRNELHTLRQDISAAALAPIATSFATNEPTISAPASLTMRSAAEVFADSQGFSDPCTTVVSALEAITYVFPSANSAEIRHLSQNDTVTIIGVSGSSNHWIQVRFGDQTGWITTFSVRQPLSQCQIPAIP